MTNSRSQFAHTLQWLPLWAVIVVLVGCESSGPPPATFVRKIDWIGKGEWVKADTHIHTKFSDGANTVSEVAFQARQHGCDVIAITDHADYGLHAATPEYGDTIRAARREIPELIILAGLEWNVPPFGGDEHATVLLPPGPREFDFLADFGLRFDDLDREPHEEALAAEALRWLSEFGETETSRPLVIYNHPNRKTAAASATASRIESWRSITDAVIGLSGAPGHQRGRQVGAYGGKVKLIDRWDPAVAEIGGAWDQLLSKGTDVWAARAPSDFHNSRTAIVADYWPGEFSETWLYVPNKTAEGALEAFRAGSFFAAHGHIAREVELTVNAAGLDRPAHAGEAIEVATDTDITVQLTAAVPNVDWEDKPNQLDIVELFVLEGDETRVVELNPNGAGALSVEVLLKVRDKGLVVRARGRRKVADGPDLLFYTNSVRVAAKRTNDDKPVPRTPDNPLDLRKLLGVALLALVGLALFVRIFNSNKANNGLQQSNSQFTTTPSTQGPNDGRPTKPWSSLEIAIYCAYAAFVISVTAYVVWSVSMTPDVGLPSTVRAKAGWAPSLGTILFVATGMAALLAVPFRPMIGILVYLVLLCGFPRYSPIFQYLLELHIPEWVCALTLGGSVIAVVRLRSLVWQPSRELTVMAVTLVVWALFSAILSGFGNSTWEFETKHHPARYLNALAIFLVASQFCVNRRDFRLLATCLTCTLILRATLFPDSIKLDGDLGHLIAMSLPLMLMTLSSTKRIAFQVIAACLVLTLGWVLFQTQSRGPALGAVLALLTLMLNSHHRWKILGVVTPILIVGAIAFQSTSYWQRFADLWEDGPAKASADSRIKLWTAAKEVWNDHPVVGVGPGNFPRVVAEYTTRDGSKRTFRGYAAHGNIQSVLAELGTVGALVYLAFFGTALVSMWRVGYFVPHAWPGAEARGIAASLIAYGGSGLFISRQDQLLPYMLVGSAATMLQFFRTNRRTLDSVQQNESRDQQHIYGVPAAPTTFSIRRYYYALAFAGSLFLVYGSLSPFHIRDLSLEQGITHVKTLLQGPWQYQPGGVDWAVNFMVTIPIALCGMGAFLQDERRPNRIALTSFGVLVYCFTLSVACEVSQIWFEGRTPSTRDIVAQLGGAVCGIAVWLIFGSRISAALNALGKTREPLHRFEWCLSAWVVGLVVYQLVPFQLIMSPAEMMTKLREGQIEIIPFSYQYRSAWQAAYSLLTDALLFIPVGMWSLTAFRPKETARRRQASALWIGLLVVVGIELVQLFIENRHSSTTDVIVAMCGVFVGAVGMNWLLRSHRDAEADEIRSHWYNSAQFSFGASLLYSLLLAGLFWAPFALIQESELVRSRINGFVEMPFGSLLGGNNLVGFFAILRKFLWFFPLGVLSANTVRCLRWRHEQPFIGVALSCATVTLVAFGVELGQIMFRGQVSTLTDALISTFGGIAGVFVCKTICGSTYITSKLATHAEPTIDAQLTRPTDTAMRSKPSSRRYLPGLNGLRALACLSVFGVHFQRMADVNVAWGPFNVSQFLEESMGVALLFVLSGFLLSLPIWSKSPEARIGSQPIRFARRRLSRIVPAYFLCLTLLIFVKRHWQNSGEVFDTLSHYVFLHNLTDFSFWGISDPFWALAPLIQFYVIFAMIIWLLDRNRWLTDRSLLIAFGSICIGSYLLHASIVQVASEVHDWPVNSAIISRDGPVITRSVLAHLPIFFAGALAAFLFARIGSTESKPEGPFSKWAADTVWIFSALLLFVGLSTSLNRFLALPHGRYHFPLATGLLVLLILATPYSRIVRSILEFSPVRRIGNISYGIYIFHVPCLIVVSRIIQSSGNEVRDHPALLGVMALCLSIAVASASYFLLEKPILRVARLKDSRPGTASSHTSAALSSSAEM